MALAGWTATSYACDVCSQAIIKQNMPWLGWSLGIALLWNLLTWLAEIRTGLRSKTMQRQYVWLTLIALLALGNQVFHSIGFPLALLLLIMPITSLERIWKKRQDLPTQTSRRLYTLHGVFASALALCIAGFIWIIPQPTKSEVIIEFEGSGYTDSLLRSSLKNQELTPFEIENIYRLSQGHNMLTIEDQIPANLNLSKSDRAELLVAALKRNWYPDFSWSSSSYEAQLEKLTGLNLPPHSTPDAWQKAILAWESDPTTSNSSAITN